MLQKKVRVANKNIVPYYPKISIKYVRFNHMHKFLLRLIIFLFCFLLLITDTAGAQPEMFSEEMHLLEMYYKKKDLIISATRHPKPVSQIAENMTVITAKDLEKINAHTITEALNRVPGIFLGGYNQDFGAPSMVTIQGSEATHVRVLLDGVTWNYLGGGNAEINSIPVGIVKQIEIIKGPASSAWGTALGGVINIITKPAGNTDKSSGEVKASYGENNTRDYSAQISCTAGPLGCYFFGGRQKSDGFENNRGFKNNSFFSKLNLHISKNTNISLSLGYNEPETGFGEFADSLFASHGAGKTVFLNTILHTDITGNLHGKVSFHHFEQRYVQKVEGINYLHYFEKNRFDEKTDGFTTSLVWSADIHTAVFGFDFDEGKLNQKNYRETEENVNRLKSKPDVEKWAAYANDTIVIDGLSITPGIRYDHNSETDSFLSPSIGVVYMLGKNSILRGSIARAFAAPPLSWTSGKSFGLASNSSLDLEEIWSYQAGMESAAIRYFWIKGTFFYHDLRETLELKPAGSTDNLNHFVNNEKIRRKGFEIELETIPFYKFSLMVGYAYVRQKNSSYEYAYNAALEYNDKKSFYAKLHGHYIWRNREFTDGSDSDDFIWDINLNKKITQKHGTVFTLFLTGHNIFNGSQYYAKNYKNPGRWIEAGLKFMF